MRLFIDSSFNGGVSLVAASTVCSIRVTSKVFREETTFSHNFPLFLLFSPVSFVSIRFISRKESSCAEILSMVVAWKKKLFLLRFVLQSFGVFYALNVLFALMRVVWINFITDDGDMKTKLFIQKSKGNCTNFFSLKSFVQTTMLFLSTWLARQTLYHNWINSIRAELVRIVHRNVSKKWARM